MTIRTYVWAILGAQAQTRSSILRKGKAFDTQKQFLANVEDAINSAVHIPDSIERYQSTLQYARSQVDFVLGACLYTIRSDMDLYLGTINGYNILTVITSPDEIKSIQLGQNTVNYTPVILQETFETPPDDFVDESVITQDEPIIPKDKPIISQSSQDETIISQVKTHAHTHPHPPHTPTQLTHDETKLAITLSGIIGGSFLI